MRHIQRSRPLASENHTPEQARHRRWTGEHLTGKGILVAAATLALELELEERARWLPRHGTITSDQVINQGACHELKSEVPLALGDPYDEGTAHIGLHSSFNRLPGRRKPVQRLGYLVIELTGVDKAAQEPFWTYASIGENMLDLAYPENVGFGYTPSRSMAQACLAHSNSATCLYMPKITPMPDYLSSRIQRRSNAVNGTATTVCFSAAYCKLVKT